MLRDKSFQKNLIFIQIISIILIGAIAVPFIIDMFKWDELKSLTIWLLEIFLAAIAIINVVLGVRLFFIKDNGLRLAHILLALANAITFLIEISFCIMRMSSIA